MLRQTLVFVLVLIVLNALFYLLNIDLRISIIGSLVVSALVTVIMNMFRR